MPDKKIFDDIARVAGSAMGTMVNFKGEIEAFIQQRIASCLSSMHLVTREEFDVVKEMASQARMEQEKLAKRLAALETLSSHKKESLDE